MATRKYVLRIAGINHDDPAMRERLIGLLNEWRDNYGTPDFVAVEWDKEKFEAVRAKRAEFGCMLRSQWADIPTDLLHTLVQSLGYEGDAHPTVYRGINTLWLDQGRSYNPRFLDVCANQKLRFYKSALGKGPMDWSRALAQISTAASNVPAPQFDPRDSKFADLVAGRAHVGRNGWAIVIVGDDHARDRQGSMRSLLEAKGYACEVCSLTAPAPKHGHSLPSSRAALILGGKTRRKCA